MWAPSAIVIFVPERKDVGPARCKLYETYGKNVEDFDGNTDAYSMWPGGGQMKFVPYVENHMSTKNRAKIERRIMIHMAMKGNAKTIPTLIKDPNITFECLEGRSIQEAVLEIMTPD